MAIYYSLTFGILVTEMIAFGVLVLPLPSRWRHAMLKFTLESPAMAKAMYFFKIIFGFILVLFIDTVNRLQRIESEVEGDQQHHHDFSYETSIKAKKFYSQRNLYLTGFTLFLSLILERTSALVLTLVQREEELKKAQIETADVTKGQQHLINMEDDYKHKVDALNVQIKELKRQKLDFDTLKKQSDQQAKEYGRLAEEHNKLERTLSTSEASFFSSSFLLLLCAHIMFIRPLTSVYNFLLTIVIFWTESVARFIVVLTPKFIIRLADSIIQFLFPWTSYTVNPLQHAATFKDMMKYWKYDYEEHFTETRDHYVLCIHRIPQGRKNTKIDCIIESGTTIVNHINDFKKPTNHNGKPVVLLYHGLTLTSEVWVSNIKHRRNLALYLSDQGYDVWMGNARGNKYSQSHLTKDPKDADFWQFSINEFAMIDMPDTIDYILKVTGAPSLTYIGFSQGTTQAFAGLSMDLELNKTVNLFIALAPAATPKGFSHPLFDGFIKAAPTVIYSLLGRKVFLKPVLFWQSVFSPALFVKIIDAAVGFLFGWHCQNIDIEQKIVGYQHLFSLTSVKSIVHWFQIIGSGRFQMYDEGSSFFTQTVDHLPPKFPIKQITTPIAVFYGSDDTLVDFDVLKNELSHLAYVKNVHGWEHMDFLWASNLEKMVFPDILMLLEHFNFKTRG